MINANHIAGLYLRRDKDATGEPRYTQEYVDTLWDSVRRLSMTVPPHVVQAAHMLGNVVPGNTLTDRDYADLTTLRVWIASLPERGRE